MRKFYKQVEICNQTDANPKKRCYTITLDGKPIKTPLKNPLNLESKKLSEKIAAEWIAQEEEIIPHTMPLTQITNTALDKQKSDVENLFPFIETDLLVYRAPKEEKALVEKQNELWDKPLLFIEKEFDINFKITNQIIPIQQPAETIQKLQKFLYDLPAFKRAAYLNLVPLTGSVVLPIYAFYNALSAEDVLNISCIDELHQIERWGHDEELLQSLQNTKKEISIILDFYRFSEEG